MKLLILLVILVQSQVYTLGIANGHVTVDNRPIVWRGHNQPEVRDTLGYVKGPSYSYPYVPETKSRVLGSVNETGKTTGNSYTWETKPRAADNFSKAVFRIWIPENVKTLRGLLVLMPGWNTNGLSLAEKEIWRTFARKNDFALVSAFLQSEKVTIKDPHWMKHCYWMTEWGSGKALIDALKKFSELAGRPEIENLPMLMWGHSAGGQFNYSFACFAPERIIGFVSVKGVYYFSKATGQTRKIPAIFILGENDHYRQIPHVTELFNKHRSHGAFWAVAVEPNAGHEIGKSNDVALPFFRALVGKRLKDEKDHYKDMQPVKPSDGWLCDLKTHDIYPYKEYPGDIKEAAWLSDKNVAEAWQRFVTDENQDSQKKNIKSHNTGK